MAFPVAAAIMAGAQIVGSVIAATSMGGESSRPKYTKTPELQKSAGRAEYMAGMGFLPEERAAAIQEGRNQSAGMFRRSMDAAGGNLARSLFAAQGADNLGFQNRLASQDANLRRANIRYADTFSRDAQRLGDANTQADLNFRMQEEKALGAALQQGMTNAVNIEGQQNLMKFYGDIYGGKGVDTGTMGGIGSAMGGAFGMKNSAIPVNQSGTVGVMTGGGDFSVGGNSGYPIPGGYMHNRMFSNPFYSFSNNFLPK